MLARDLNTFFNGIKAPDACDEVVLRAPMYESPELAAALRAMGVDATVIASRTLSSAAGWLSRSDIVLWRDGLGHLDAGAVLLFFRVQAIGSPSQCFAFVSKYTHTGGSVWTSSNTSPVAIRAESVLRALPYQRDDDTHRLIVPTVL